MYPALIRRLHPLGHGDKVCPGQPELLEDMCTRQATLTPCVGHAINVALCGVWASSDLQSVVIVWNQSDQQMPGWMGERLPLRPSVLGEHVVIQCATPSHFVGRDVATCAKDGILGLGLL